jgi:signal transduction histidine kinase
MIFWLPVEVALSRLVWLLVLRGGWAADGAIEHAEGARRSAAVAEAARAAEREYMATLHDTAASTFLMVGLGEVNMAESWLRAQAQRDLQVFDDRGFTSDDEIDLSAMVRDTAGNSRLQVSTDLLDTCVIPATTAAAICQAVLEALTNVDRHAHTGAAHVSISSENGELRVAVSDEGSGFLLERVPAERRGISQSIVNRVAAVGGRVSILSAPAAGTTICLVLRR